MSEPEHPHKPVFEAGEPHQAGLPVLVEESFRVALVQERDAVRKSYLEITELRHRLVAAETRAARVRNSLSFRLGHAISVTTTAKDYLTLGPRLIRAYREFHRQKKKVRVAVSVPAAMARRAAALQQALALAQSKGSLQAAQWARGNVRRREDLAHVLVEIGFLALAGDDYAAAAEMAGRAKRLDPDSLRLKGLVFSLDAASASPPLPGTEKLLVTT